MVPRIKPAAKMFVSTTPAARGLIGAQRLRLDSDVGFMDLGAVPSHGDHIKASCILSFTEAVTASAVSNMFTISLLCL